MPFPIKVTIFWSLFKIKNFTKIKSRLLSFWFVFLKLLLWRSHFSFPLQHFRGQEVVKITYYVCKTMKWMMKLYNQSKIHALWTHYSHTSESIHKILSSFYRFSNQVVQKVNSETIVDVRSKWIYQNKQKLHPNIYI